jgi:hypothetical protein
MPLALRNVQADPAEPVKSGLPQALVTAMDRGGFRDWQPVAQPSNATRGAKSPQTCLGNCPMSYLRVLVR